MPLYRRLPKRGFTNIFAKKWAVINVGDLNSLRAGSSVTPDVLKEKGLIKKLGDGLRVLGRGELEKKLKIKAHHFSAAAREKIEKAGGTAEVIS